MAIMGVQGGSDSCSSSKGTSATPIVATVIFAKSRPQGIGAGVEEEAAAVDAAVDAAAAELVKEGRRDDARESSVRFTAAPSAPTAACMQR